MRPPPARRSLGTSTWRRGATRGGTLGQCGPAEGPVWPPWPARQQRLMPQPRLLHLAQDGAPCSNCCHCPPTAGGYAAGPRAGRRGAARADLRAWGSRGSPPSRGRVK